MNRSLIFIDTTRHLNHETILNKAIGASEYQFYNLIKQLSNTYNIVCYNCNNTSNIIDNIQYKNLNDITHDIINIDTPIIIQRFIPDKNKELYNTIKNNKIFVWIHDIFVDGTINFNYKKGVPTDISLIRNEIYNNKNIHFVCVSEHCKSILLNYFLNNNIVIEPNRVNVIYNILYNGEFNDPTNNDIIVNKKYITYASAWQKGIEHIIKIFDELLKVDNDFILILLSPGYDYNNFNSYADTIKEKYGNNIIIHGPINKIEYSKIIKESLLVLSPRFNETFGCVFAESYYLGTPVIADYKSGAVKEIIDNNYIVNYNNINETIEKILYIKHNRETIHVHLDNKFMIEHNVKLWINLL
jgi:glycosyltransferase involved in cell wall biosynthesis